MASIRDYTNITHVCLPTGHPTPFYVVRDTTTGRWHMCLPYGRKKLVLFVHPTEFLCASEAKDYTADIFHNLYRDPKLDLQRPPFHLNTFLYYIDRAIVTPFPTARCSSPYVSFRYFDDILSDMGDTSTSEPFEPTEPPKTSETPEVPEVPEEPEEVTPEEAVRTERGSIYGDPFLNHQGIAMMWASLLAPWWERIRNYEPLPPHVIALLFSALKLNRMRLRFHEDNFVDLYNYAIAFAREWQRIHETSPSPGSPPDPTR